MKIASGENVVPHPILHSYADTSNCSFPLILIFGREPNTDRPIDGELGLYDFQEYPHCGFWNTSYSVIGQVAGLTIGEFKQYCLQQRSSPILYSDALPIGLKYVVRDKQLHRSLVTPELIRGHISRIFGLRSLIDRVELVLMSGLYSPTFDQPVTEIESHCNQRSICFLRLPFFYGTNTQKIHAALSREDRECIRLLIGQFCQPQRIFSVERPNKRCGRPAR